MTLKLLLIAIACLAGAAALRTALRMRRRAQTRRMFDGRATGSRAA